MNRRLAASDAEAIREAVAFAIVHAPRGLQYSLGSDPEASLVLVDAARVAAEEAGRLLRQSISSARTAGTSWDAVGEILGVSRQAAQQRFGSAQASGEDMAGDRRVLSPVTAFDEMDALADVGRHGWHSVDYGTLHHVLEKSDRQWEHRRALWGTVQRSQLESDGWQLIRGNTFPWSYWAKPLDVPALPDARPE
jgi:hypothetical protein